MILSSVSAVYQNRNSLAVAVSQTTHTAAVRHAILAVAREKCVKHCIDCAKYRCKSFRTRQAMAKLLSHFHGADAGLKSIKLDGVDLWLDVQKKHWSCPDCGTSFSWYATACSKCGRSLASKAHKLSGWKTLQCRFMLAAAYLKGKTENKIVERRQCSCPATLAPFIKIWRNYEFYKTFEKI